MNYFTDRIIGEARANALEMEKAGTLSPALLHYAYERKLFKLFVPKELGGLMLGLPEALKVFEQASWIDGSFGWLVTIGSGGGFFSATLPKEISREVFSDPKAVVAGSGHANGIARPVDGGYIVSGQWRYCSGSTYASVFTANCRIDGADGLEQIRSFAFEPDQVSIIRDWKSFGLKSTDSHSIAVDEVFVPAERTFDILSEPLYGDPIFRYPFMAFAQTSFAAVSIGLGWRFLEEAREFADERRDDWQVRNPRRLEALYAALEEGERDFDAAARQFHETVEWTWSAFVREGGLTEGEEREVGHCSQQAAKTALSCAHAVFPYLGMTALMEDEPLNRIWRDLHTVTQHAVLTPL